MFLCMSSQTYVLNVYNELCFVFTVQFERGSVVVRHSPHTPSDVSTNLVPDPIWKSLCFFVHWFT